MVTIIKMTIYSSIPYLPAEKQSYKHYEGLTQPGYFSRICSIWRYVFIIFLLIFLAFMLPFIVNCAANYC
jgi:hypothetical protein